MPTDEKKRQPPAELTLARPCMHAKQNKEWSRSCIRTDLTFLTDGKLPSTILTDLFHSVGATPVRTNRSLASTALYTPCLRHVSCTLINAHRKQDASIKNIQEQCTGVNESERRCAAPTCFTNNICKCAAFFAHFQMTLYVFFPVGVFYYFNAPGYFDHQVERKRVRRCVCYTSVQYTYCRFSYSHIRVGL